MFVDKVKEILLDGGHSDDLFKEANDLSSCGDYEGALVRLCKCIKLQPGWSPPYNTCAWIYAIHDCELDDALNYINKALEIKNNSANYYDTLGEVYCRKHEFNNAIKAFDKCLKLRTPAAVDDANYSTVFRLGVCYLEIENYPAAYDFLVKAVSLKPDNPKIYNSIGDACRKGNIYMKAIDYYNKAIDLAPDWNFSHPIEGRPNDQNFTSYFIYVCLVNQSDAYQNIGDDDKCFKCNERAYSIFQDNPVAPINLASLYAKKGNKQQTRKFLEEGIPLINPEYDKDTMSTLLYYDYNFEEDRELILKLLLKQNKISRADYDQYMEAFQNRKTSGVKPSKPSYNINVGHIERFTMSNETSRIITAGNYAEQGTLNSQGPAVGSIYGSVDFNSTHSVADFVSELQKLKGEIEKAKNNNTLDKESATKTESHVTDAITQSCKPNPDKGVIVRSLDKATEFLNSVKGVAEAAKPIVTLLGAAAVAAARLFA